MFAIEKRQLIDFKGISSLGNCEHCMLISIFFTPRWDPNRNYLLRVRVDLGIRVMKGSSTLIISQERGHRYQIQFSRKPPFFWGGQFFLGTQSAYSESPWQSEKKTFKFCAFVTSKKCGNLIYFHLYPIWQDQSISISSVVCDFYS